MLRYFSWGEPVPAQLPPPEEAAQALSVPGALLPPAMAFTCETSGLMRLRFPGSVVPPEGAARLLSFGDAVELEVDVRGLPDPRSDEQGVLGQVPIAVVQLNILPILLDDPEARFRKVRDQFMKLFPFPAGINGPVHDLLCEMQALHTRLSRGAFDGAWVHTLVARDLLIYHRFYLHFRRGAAASIGADNVEFLVIDELVNRWLFASSPEERAVKADNLDALAELRVLA